MSLMSFVLATSLMATVAGSSEAKSPAGATKPQWVKVSVYDKALNGKTKTLVTSGRYPISSEKMADKISLQTERTYIKSCTRTKGKTLLTPAIFEDGLGAAAYRKPGGDQVSIHVKWVHPGEPFMISHRDDGCSVERPMASQGILELKTTLSLKKGERTTDAQAGSNDDGAPRFIRISLD